MVLKRTFWVRRLGANFLGTLSTDTSGQLDVLGHDGDPLGVDGAEIGVLEKADKIGLGSLLKSHNSGTLEPQISLEVLSDFTHESLEGKFADQELCGLLVPPDLSEGNSSRSVAMGLLDSSSGWGRLPGSLGGQLLPRGLASSGLTGGLLGSCHVGLLVC